MRSTFDIALLEKPGTEGLLRSEAADLYDLLPYDEAYPLEVPSKEHEGSAMGFISPEAAEKLSFDYEKSGLNGFVAGILDDMETETETWEYEYKGLHIYIGR